MTTSFIEVKSLRKLYGQTVAVDDVSLSLDEGRTAAIIGSSGCGKSTFLRCLNLLEMPTSGAMRIGEYSVGFSDGKMTSGEDVSLRFRKSMAMVFQSFDLFPHMTALNNIALAPTIVNGIRREEARENALRLLDRVDLKHKADAYPGQLSGGQAQRVAIARALAMNPRVLLFDEATSALDPELVKGILALIAELGADGMTMVVVTHEMAFARSASDTVVFMDRGKVVESGPPEQIFDNAETERLQKFLSQVL